MKKNEYQSLLIKALTQLDESEKWLPRSFNRCQSIDLTETLKEDDFDTFETLTGRFARVSDIILQKVFKNIDKLEFEEGRTLLDMLNRAEKRHLIESVEQIRDIRELRNEIFHNYALDDIEVLFSDTLNYSPVLFSIISNVRDYCKKYSD